MTSVAIIVDWRLGSKEQSGDGRSDEVREQHGQKTPSEISGGMQKRVGLARALVLDPDILLFDEPTAGLDPITAAEIDHLIVDLRRTQAHFYCGDARMRGAKTFADRLVMLRDGKIVAEGSFAELQKSQDSFVQGFVGAEL